ncbi:MAG: glycosyltransferase [Candidatus Micrarchaeia archaeon]
MMDRWLGEGPALSELASVVADRRERKGSIAIVIPTFRKKALVSEHLRRLSSQTEKDFDVVIVYGPGDEIVEAPEGLNVVHMMANGDYGSAGGFYCGEGFAMEQGYEKVILADDDCLPESDDLVRMLSAGLDEGAALVVPKIAGYADEAPAPSCLPPQYGCVKGSVLRQVGLTYLPFYFGGEDLEIYRRIAGSGDVAYADAVASHHPLQSLFMTSLERIFYYDRGGLLAGYLSGSALRSFGGNFFFLYGSAAFWFIDRRISSVLFDAVAAAASMGFSRSRHGRTVPAQPCQAAGHDAIPIRNSEPGTIQMGDYRYLAILADKVARLAGGTLKAAGAFGKDVRFSRKVGVGNLPVLLSARRCFLEVDGKTYKVADNPRYYLAPLEGALLIAAFPAMASLAAVFTCAGFFAKWIRRIDTYGYGVKARRG